MATDEEVEEDAPPIFGDKSDQLLKVLDRQAVATEKQADALEELGNVMADLADVAEGMAKKFSMGSILKNGLGLGAKPDKKRRV